MKIEVLGTGCRSCENLYETVTTVVAEMNIQPPVEITKVSDIAYFVKMGVFMTPGLVIDGKVVASGRTLDGKQVRARIQERLTEIAPT